MAQPLMDGGRGKVVSAVHPVLLSWQDVSYTVKEKRKGTGIVDKPILKGICGNAPPGSFTAILGASGSGKTSLLSVLADRLLFSKGATLTGKLTVNGEATPADYRSRCAFVQQTEVFYPYSTVRETVEMSARMRLGSAVAKDTKKQRACDVIQLLGLSKAIDAIVGNGASIKGISGGEMKRVGIACELVCSPSLVMLDEPTSGLDSTAALNVVSSLTELAKNGHTVIASIHQPGSAIYALFDRVIVLAEGGLAYFGPASEVVSHFSKIGHVCPSMYNPAEYVLQATAILQDREEESRQSLSKILQQGALMVSDASRQIRSSGMGPAPPCSTSYCEQFSLLYRRILRDAIRNKVALIIKVVQGLVTTLIMVGLYSNIDGGGSIRITTTNISALLFFISINGLFGPLFGTINSFAPEVSIVLRERMNNLYAMAPYYLAKISVAIPIEILPLLIGNTVAYWWLKLNHSFANYCTFLLFTCGCTLSSVGLGFVLASATGGNIQAASACVGPIALIFLLLGGFFINTSTIPIWISWLSKINYVSWAYQGLSINQFNGHVVKAAGVALTSDGHCLPGSSEEVCEEGTFILGVLFNNGTPRTEDEWESFMWLRFLFIAICIATLNFVGYLVLLSKGPKYLQIH